MNISGQQQKYGAYWGIAAFGIGVTVAWWFLEPVEGGGPDRLHRAIWLFLSSHFFAVGPIKVEQIVTTFPRLALVETGRRPMIWYAIPLFSAAAGAVGVNMRLGRTQDHELILQNSGTILFGYLPAATAAIVWSNAAPSIGILVLIIAIAFLALFIGSSVLGQVNRQAPAFAITSMSGLVGIGLVVVLGGWLLVQLLVPITTAIVGGLLFGSAVTYIGRNY